MAKDFCTNAIGKQWLSYPIGKMCAIIGLPSVTNG
jgi:hypothetical protein